MIYRLSLFSGFHLTPRAGRAILINTVSYLRVSTDAQDTAKNKLVVYVFANERKYGRVEFVEEEVSWKVPWRERKIKSVLDGLEEGYRLIVPELSRLGRSALEVLRSSRRRRTRTWTSTASRKASRSMGTA